jgi:hypothetical protein
MDTQEIIDREIWSGGDFPKGRPGEPYWRGVEERRPDGRNVLSVIKPVSIPHRCLNIGLWPCPTHTWLPGLEGEGNAAPRLAQDAIDPLLQWAREPARWKPSAKCFARTLKMAELSGFRVYDCRHTYASLLLNAGAPITYVAAQLGHTKPTTILQWYAHFLPGIDDHRFGDGLDGDGGNLWHQFGTKLRSSDGLGKGRKKKAPVSKGFLSGPRVTRTLDPLIKSLGKRGFWHHRSTSGSVGMLPRSLVPQGIPVLRLRPW